MIIDVIKYELIICVLGTQERRSAVHRRSAVTPKSSSPVQLSTRLMLINCTMQPQWPHTSVTPATTSSGQFSTIKFHLMSAAAEEPQGAANGGVVGG